MKLKNMVKHTSHRKNTMVWLGSPSIAMVESPLSVRNAFARKGSSSKSSSNTSLNLVVCSSHSGSTLPLTRPLPTPLAHLSVPYLLAGGRRLLSHYLFWIILLPFAREHEDRDASLLLHVDSRGSIEPPRKVGACGGLVLGKGQGP